MGERFSELYFQLKDKPYAGVFMMLRQTLMVNDLDQIKTILVKDFSHFTDHSFEMNEKYEPLANHLFNLGGEKWKNLRIKMTPTFTTSKMKMMFDSINSCADVMKNYLVNDIKDGNIEDVKEILSKFSTDVIGCCAFGIECDSFKNPNSQFRKMGKRVFHMPFHKAVLQMSLFFFPSMVTKINFSILGSDMNNFFYNLVKDTIEYREKNNIVRNDFLQLLMELRNEESANNSVDDKSEAPPDDGTRLTMMQLAAQVFVFFIAGFETSSTTASFALYELALNPDVQKTLTDEIDDILAKHDGKITYDSLGEMTYLTKVIEETLRKYPPLPVLFRICTKDYILPDTNIKIEKDTPVMIPVYGIQRDPDIYPNPNKFDPERFTPENKAARHHFAYLPFGEGPRICIGSRFGMMQTKLGLATFLSKYEVSVCDKTLIPMEYDKRSFVLTSNGGLWLKLKRRSK
ncbi:putative cytochrome P450 6a14 isoform X3 [Arctopsyche grandis]|uniref:putative cytochrome P450 6a14 isoform X3 n=1 Tax=Arctopsyche grandis TaxID=121162 RepID=UPI00406D719E